MLGGVVVVVVGVVVARLEPGADVDAPEGGD